ncbi:MAG TPA: M28 family peptidase [Pyrinomonadaceae bacterium]|jgi:Zn-dependent M28 family amino/carboxypeptidase
MTRLNETSARPSGPQAHTSLALLLLLPLTFIACPGSSTPDANVQQASAPVAAAPAAPASPASSASPVTARPAFDGERAFAHVSKMVALGPRPAGSAELARTRQYIIGELQAYGLKVTTDEFTAKTPQGDKKMVNVTAELPGQSPDAIIIGSHYDTKPYKTFRFVGANDAGSSTGALLELARALKGEKPRLTYWFVFFDGEEAFCPGWDDCSKPDAPDNTYGSRRYVAHLKEQNQLARVRAMILLDMMGYKNLQLQRDDMGTRWIEDVIWGAARDIGHGDVFVEGAEGVGGDDHEPFLKAGIEAVDIIQLNGYPYWHTAEDTLDKISPRSLQVVGETLVASLPRLEQRLQK